MGDDIPVLLPPRLIKQAQLYAAGRSDSEAVQHVIEDYPRLVAELRQLRRRVIDIDDEGAALDARLAALQAACRAILEL